MRFERQHAVTHADGGFGFLAAVAQGDHVKGHTAHLASKQSHGFHLERRIRNMTWRCFCSGEQTTRSTMPMQDSTPRRLSSLSLSLSLVPFLNFASLARSPAAAAQKLLAQRLGTQQGIERACPLLTAVHACPVTSRSLDRRNDQTTFTVLLRACVSVSVASSIGHQCCCCCQSLALAENSDAAAACTVISRPSSYDRRLGYYLGWRI